MYLELGIEATACAHELLYLYVYVYVCTYNCNEHYASAEHYAYDVIEVHVPRKKNFKFGL